MQSGPAAPELAADANDCIMVRSSNRSTEYKAVARDQRNTNGELASDFHRRLQLAVSHVTSNQVGLCDAAPNRRILPSCSRGPRQGERICVGGRAKSTNIGASGKRGERVANFKLDNESPIQGFRPPQ